MTITSDSVRRRVTRDTAAILSVDLLGVPCDTTALRQIADEFGLWYIADAASSLGARRNGRPAGAGAHALVLSFTEGKPVSAGEGGAILTDNPDLYETLVWYGQHPARQRRDLGLHLTNEFAFNARMHPLAAEQANRRFESGLENVARRRERCNALADSLNSTGLTQPIRFREEGIEPSFFGFSAAWAGRSMEMELVARLGMKGYETKLDPFPYQIVYQQSAFVSQFAGLMRGTPQCRVAMAQARKRFCLRCADQHA